MAESESPIHWKTWVYPSILSGVLTLAGLMFPDQAKTLGTKIIEHWDWIGPLLAVAAYVLLFVMVFRELRRIKTTGVQTNKRSQKMAKRVKGIEMELRGQSTRIGAATDRIETLERKIINPDN